MKIEYLEQKGFTEEKTDINKLKISIGKVEFDKEGEVSTIKEPDLRYFLDEDSFGLHISDSEYSSIDWIEFLKENQQFISKLKVVYISRTNLESFVPLTYNFSGLEFLNLSENKNLDYTEIRNFQNLKAFDASNCVSLKKVEFIGTFDKLERIDVSNGDIEILNIENIEFPALTYLNIQNNQLKELAFFGINEIEYFFGRNNPFVDIKWPSQFNKISVFEIDSHEALDESLMPILQKTDNQLLESLNAYVNDFRDKGIIAINRLKLIFIGNTTAGKSTLRRILLSAKNKEIESAKEEEKSTHGVSIFNKTLNINGIAIFVQGFDFGGQDYYHATHLPFYGYNSLNLLVYGYDGEQANFKKNSAYQFSKKDVEGREEILYPINYWIGSLNKKKPIEVGNTQGKIQNLKEFHKPKLELVQNTRNPDGFQELNNLEIRSNENITIGDIKNFNFFNDAKKTKKWLFDKIAFHANERSFLKADEDLADWFQNQNEVVFSLENLLKNKEITNLYNNKVSLQEALKRLDSHHFGYYFDSKQSDENSFYISKIETFSYWYHEFVLTKELINRGGYFEKSDIVETSIQAHVNEIIRYLEGNNIIFKVKDATIEKWVAPAYLSAKLSKAEELLFDSFDLPDAKFEFTGFFHSNIILMIIDAFEENLVLDANQKEFLLWKNKVILHQKKPTNDANQKGKNEKAFLLIELKYPGDEHYDGVLPQLSIARNISGFVKDSIFEKIFSFILEKLEAFNPKIEVKTRYNDYIPFECLFQENKLDSKIRSNLIFHNQTIYSSYDFRHFWQGSTTEPTKIFIGYSKFDIEYVNELISHLTPYENQGDVVIYYDKNLKMGEKWDEELKYQLIHSDIFVCLVSPNMLCTQYVVDLELPLAHEHNKEIVPIIIAECNWSYPKLNNNKNLLVENNAYTKATPLPSDKYSRDKEWKIIAENLKNKTPNQNGTNTTISPASTIEHDSGNHQKDGGEQ